MKKKSNFSILNILTEPWESITHNIVFFVLSTILFSFILLSLSFAFGQTFSCALGQGGKNCTLSLPVYAFYFVTKLLILSTFVTIWYAKVYQDKQINEKFLIADWRMILRVFCIFWIFLIFNIMPLVSVYLLLVRVPNPNWVIEAGYFIVVSLGLWLPFILMRMYALLVDLIAGNGFKNYAAIWKGGQGNGLKMLLATSFYFFFVIILFSSIAGVVRGFNFASPIMFDFVGEFGFDVVTLFGLLLFVGFFQSLKNNLINQSEETA